MKGASACGTVPSSPAAAMSATMPAIAIEPMPTGLTS